MDKNFHKLLQTSILIASLIMLPFPLAAPAKSTNETAYLKDLQSGISNLGSSILQMQQQYLQQKKNLNDQINRNKYLAQYKPKGEPSKYFPRCIVPPTIL